MLLTDTVAAPFKLLLPEAAMFMGDQVPATDTPGSPAPSDVRITATVATQLRVLLPVEVTDTDLTAMRGITGTGVAGLGEGLRSQWGRVHANAEYGD
jgi:hypothetical protein